MIASWSYVAIGKDDALYQARDLVVAEMRVEDAYGADAPLVIFSVR